MMSDPQLRKDIVALQEKLIAAKARISELESQPPKMVVKEVIKEVPGPVQYVHKDVVKEVPGPVQYVHKEVIKEVPMVEIRRVEVPVIKEVPAPYKVTETVTKYVKCPKQAAIIKELQSKLGGE